MGGTEQEGLGDGAGAGLGLVEVAEGTVHGGDAGAGLGDIVDQSGGAREARGEIALTQTAGGAERGGGVEQGAGFGGSAELAQRDGLVAPGLDGRR